MVIELFGLKQSYGFVEAKVSAKLVQIRSQSLFSKQGEEFSVSL